LVWANVQVPDLESVQSASTKAPAVLKTGEMATSSDPETVVTELLVAVAPPVVVVVLPKT
jgi:hypothetical protein